MVLAFAPGTDFEDICDGLEAVTVVRRGTSNTAVASALQRAVTTAEAAASDGKYTNADTRWHLPVAECATCPRPGDAIEDAAGDRYTVLAARADTLGRRWLCITRNMTVVYHLDDTITIEEATYSKGTGGAAQRTYAVWRTGVRARVQEETVAIATELDAKQPSKTYGIYIGEDIALDHRHRIKDREGYLYQVLSYAGREEIGRLQRIEATTWR